MRRIWGIFVTAFALLLVLPGAALAQQYPPGAAATCPTGTVVAGGTITCSAAGFAPGSTVTAEVAGTNFTRTRTVTANQQGVATATIDIPADAALGGATVTFTGTDVSGRFLRVAAAQFTVVAPAAGLPTTGTGVTNGLLGALAVLILGGLSLTAARRRSQKDTAAHS